MHIRSLWCSREKLDQNHIPLNYSYSPYSSQAVSIPHPRKGTIEIILMPTQLTGIENRAPLIYTPQLQGIILHLLIPTLRTLLLNRLVPLHIILRHVLDGAVLGAQDGGEHSGFGVLFEDFLGDIWGDC
jgi:hypothetical protein